MSDNPFIKLPYNNTRHDYIIVNLHGYHCLFHWAATGRIVEAFYGGMPEFIGKQTLSYLVVEFKGITEQFIQKYCNIQPRPYKSECDVPINSRREKMSQHRWLVDFYLQV